MTTRQTTEAEPLLTPAEVATMFRVDPKTVTRWAKAGKLTSIRTLGGHRRYKESEVRGLLEGGPTKVDDQLTTVGIRRRGVRAAAALPFLVDRADRRRTGKDVTLGV
jgi:excisionase family DNA binding protein